MSKEEKLEILMEIRELFLERQRNNKLLFLCHILQEVLTNKYGKKSTVGMYNEIKEDLHVQAYKTRDFLPNNYTWWHMGNNIPRLQTIDFTIEEIQIEIEQLKGSEDEKRD